MLALLTSLGIAVRPRTLRRGHSLLLLVKGWQICIPSWTAEVTEKVDPYLSTLHLRSKKSLAGSGSRGCRQEVTQWQQYWSRRAGYEPGMAQSWRPCTHRSSLEEPQNQESGFSQGHLGLTCTKTPLLIRLSIIHGLFSFHPVCSFLQLSGRYERTAIIASKVPQVHRPVGPPTKFSDLGCFVGLLTAALRNGKWLVPVPVMAPFAGGKSMLAQAVARVAR